MAYRIVFTPEARKHFAGLDAHRRTLLRDRMLVQLSHQPAAETRHRRRLRPNELAMYRLRVADMRVYYEVVQGDDPMVVVKAVGLKIRDRVVIAGEEIDLT